MQILVKKFLTYDQLIELLRNRGLIINDEKRAKLIIASVSYYDLVNGYKEIYCQPDSVYELFEEGTTIEDVYSFHLLNTGVQNVLFKYSMYVENTFKNALAYVISKNISEDEFYYLSESFYQRKRGIYKKTKRTLNTLNKLCDPNNKKVENPTRFYIDNHNHIPPWILFKNATFSTCIDLFSCLRTRDKREVVENLISIEINEDYRNDFVMDALTTIRKFRNAIAHNLKFVTLRISKQQRLSFSQLIPEFGGTLINVSKDSGAQRGIGDPYSMILSLISLLLDKKLVESLFYDLSHQFKDISDSNAYSRYCTITGIPEDILQRGVMYIDKIKNG